MREDINEDRLFAVHFGEMDKRYLRNGVHLHSCLKHPIDNSMTLWTNFAAPVSVRSVEDALVSGARRPLISVA